MNGLGAAMCTVARRHVRQNHLSEATQQDERKAPAKVNQADAQTRQKAIIKQGRKQRLLSRIARPTPDKEGKSFDRLKIPDKPKVPRSSCL